MSFYFVKQGLWYFGSTSPAIRYSPDETCETSKHTLKTKKSVLKSGAAAAVGFILPTAVPFGHLNPVKARVELLLPKITVKLTETSLKELSTFQQDGYKS
ncbi:hypothetical protein [Pedobacter sp. KACC 23697]|uniref:Uncharacterized protein n=1 Tax=Pedobacter sp. KACC 23697 TaxID=3149230 RepID=A0AAU7K1K4_9SPHI